MTEIQEIIKKFLSVENNLNKIRNVFSRHNIKEDLDNFLSEMVSCFIDGDLDASIVGDYISEEFDLTPQEGEQISDELYDEILYEIYDELDENYNIHQKELNEFEKTFLSSNNEEVIKSTESLSDQSDQVQQNNLTQKYNTFSISSLFQNILAAEESFKSKYFIGGILNTTGIKEEFYEALNSSDKIKVAGALRVLAGAGQLGVSFANDQRYLDFWGNFLERHYGLEIKQKFLVEPSNKKYFVEFLRFALEKRLNFNIEESAMIGMGLASLCGASGESALAEMAYGDEQLGRFVWNE